jgi:hypothetical protein
VEERSKKKEKEVKEVELLKKIFFIILIFNLNSCTSEWESPSGDRSRLNQDQRYCKATARAVAPIYICRNPLLCTPDETSRVIQSITSHNAYFDKCMFEQGNKVK